MDWFTRRKPFSDAAKAAFPPGCMFVALEAEDELKPFVDDRYRITSRQLIVDGASVYVPYRLHFVDDGSMSMGPVSSGAHCLLTRATDGHVRQAAAGYILGLNYPWTIPFVVLLLGEYVLEIAEDVAGALPHLDRTAYREFVLQNRGVMRRLRARATSYWNIYHRGDYPDRRMYPALATLTTLEEWAS